MGRTAWRGIAFYVAVAAFLGAIVGKKLTLVLPAGIASQIGHNSESLLFALVVCAEIQYLRPVLLRSARPWLLVVPGALALCAAGFYLAQSSLPPSLVTLNEPVLAGGLMLGYVALPRPLPLAPLIGLGVLVFIVVFFKTAFVLDQAESLVPILIAPFALDVFDRTLLEPERRDRPALRTAWCVALVLVGLAFMVLARWARKDLHGPLRFGIDYGQRASEAYWGWLLVHFYLSYWIGSARRAGSAESSLALTPSTPARDV